MADTEIPFDSAVFDRLLAKRIIVLGTEVNDESANRICGQLILLAAEDHEKDINLWINSPGGVISAGLAIYDTMRFVPNDVSTVVMGMAASMGQFLLSAGTQRRDFTYVGDVVEGLLRLGLVDHEYAPRALNVANGELHTVREFVERASDVLAIARERLQFGALETRPEEMQHDAVSTASLHALVGWAPNTSIESGVRQAHAFRR